ncbi:hypothetical protein CBS101457_000129 [Exobasidium rhododendri]|nr:hypothetical protein CBS101457_000129 [Exobasidium rhododendri]
MSMEESKIVVRKIAQASGGKDEEHIRNFFLQTQLEADVAMAILYDTVGEVCQRYVMRMGLDRQNDKIRIVEGEKIPPKTIVVWPWMQGLRQDQKKKDTVIHRLMRATTYDEKECYSLLRQPQVSENTGKMILEAKNYAEVRKIVHGLLYSKPVENQQS